MRRAEINGTEIAYAGAGSGEVVLLLHCGFVTESGYPLLQQRTLTDDYQLIHYHRRGYGKSGPATSPFSMAEQAADALALLDHLGIAQAHIAGHSFGAVIALEIARRAPTRVATLALLEPPLGFALTLESGQILGAAIGQSVQSFMAGKVERAVNEWLDPAFGLGWQEVVNRTLPGGYAQVVKDGPTALGIEAAALQSWDYGPDQLAAISQPTLALYHRDARFAIFDEIQQMLVTCIPNVQSLEIPRASHLLQIEEPQAVAQGLAAFYARQPQPARALP
jgi:pimeloyl-ACP methyl ester carboxylesterase